MFRYRYKIHILYIQGLSDFLIDQLVIQFTNCWYFELSCIKGLPKSGLFISCKCYWLQNMGRFWQSVFWQYFGKPQSVHSFIYKKGLILQSIFWWLVPITLSQSQTTQMWGNNDLFWGTHGGYTPHMHIGIYAFHPFYKLVTWIFFIPMF